MSQRKAQPATTSTSRMRTIGIRTLGEFRLSLDGRSVQFQHRTQRRVLELLKALIALGRPSVSAARLMDIFWNESDGDQANRCLATTVYRLRELLRAKDAVLHANGQLVLNPRYCSVDAWVVERHLVAIESSIKTSFPDVEKISRRHLKIAELYRGDFLDADRNYPWTDAVREQLRARYLHALRAWGQCLQQLDRHEEAALAFRRGIEVNHLAEECYYQLMRCQVALGRRTEAVLLYRRCCNVLREDLDLQPALQTRSLYLSLREEKEIPGGELHSITEGRRLNQPAHSKKSFLSSIT